MAVAEVIDDQTDSLDTKAEKFVQKQGFVALETGTKAVRIFVATSNDGKSVHHLHAFRLFTK